MPWSSGILGAAGVRFAAADPVGLVAPTFLHLISGAVVIVALQMPPVLPALKTPDGQRRGGSDPDGLRRAVVWPGNGLLPAAPTRSRWRSTPPGHRSTHSEAGDSTLFAASSSLRSHRAHSSLFHSSGNRDDPPIIRSFVCSAKDHEPLFSLVPDLQQPDLILHSQAHLPPQTPQDLSLAVAVKRRGPGRSSMAADTQPAKRSPVPESFASWSPSKEKVES